jgi:FkbM family methyltransferase
MNNIPEKDILIKEIQGIKFAIWKKGDGIHREFISWPQNATADIREPEFMYIFRKELPINGVIIDLGANIGYNTLTAADIISSIGGHGTILSIEPDPRNYQLLIKAIKENHFEARIYPYNLAIGGYTGQQSFYLSRATNLNGFTNTDKMTDMINVHVETLWDFICERGFPNPNFIKMDIEGAEVDVLEGGMKLFELSFPCKILMEVHPKYYTEERSLAKQLWKMIGLGFKIKYVCSAAVQQPKVFKDAGYKPEKTFSSNRGLYINIKIEDAITWASTSIPQKYAGGISPKVVRSIMLERE